MKLSKRGIPYYGKKSSNYIVHSNDATYSKLHVPIVRNIIKMLLCELSKLKMTEHISKLIQNCSVLITFL